MTIIVAHPREGVLLADRFQVIDNEEYKGITDMNIAIVDKLQRSADNHFAYVFDYAVETQDVAVILNYLLRFENGSLPKDELLILPDKDYTGYFMSKRNFYRVEADAEYANVTVRKMNYIGTNVGVLDNVLMDALGFTASDVFDCARRSGSAHSNDYTTVKQSELVLIKPVKKTRGKKI